ncbi:hypothetical protein CMU25_09410 [Elizabethkingia anophelis]|nr:hypothetical protein [Elizabethkingia anophelis]MDV3840557.1 hypothetical protein [Elizabethkingia anophelis]
MILYYFYIFTKIQFRMNNEFKIKIISNSEGNSVDLNNISLDAADALKVFIESLTGFAKSYDTEDVTLSLKNGSIEACLVFDDKNIISDIKDITEYKSFEAERTKYLKAIQDKIKMNGLAYEVYIKEKGISTDLTPKFKAKNFPVRRGKIIPYKYEIVFLSGELFEAGGKSTTNIHILKGESEFKINCSRIQAQKINERLYSKVYLSVLKRWRKEEKIEYSLIDSYLSEDKYDFYEDFHTELKLRDTLEKYDLIHEKVVEIYENKNLENTELIKLMRLYDNQYSDRGILRTLLMSIKPILSQNEDLKYYYKEVANRLRRENSNNKI